MFWPPFFLRPRSPAPSVQAQPTAPGRTSDSRFEGAASSVDLELLRATVDIDQGLPVVQSQALLQFFMDELVETRISLGIGPELFAAICVPVVESLANWVQTLPATRTAEYRRPLGALRRAISVGRVCARDGLPVIFNAEASQTDRRLLQNHWRIACWLAGALSDLGFLVDQVAVLDDDGRTWSPGVQSLSTWAGSQGVSRIWVRWFDSQPGDRQRGAANGYIASRVLPAHVFNYLHGGSGELARVCLDTIAGVSSDVGRTLFQTVSGARARASTVDRAADPIHYGRPVLGVVVAQFIVAAMKDCLETQVWSVNERRATVFHTTFGTFLKWPYAVKGIRAALNKQNVAPVPVEPAVLIDILHKADLIETRPGLALASDLWRIHVCGVELDAIKLRDSHVLIGEGESVPLVECRIELARETRSSVGTKVPEPNNAALGDAAPDPTATQTRQKKEKRAGTSAPAAEKGSVSEQLPTEAAFAGEAQVGTGESGKQTTPTPASWESVVGELNSRERTLVNRLRLVDPAPDGSYSPAALAASGLTFTVMLDVLKRLGAATETTDDRIRLQDSFMTYLKQS